MSVSGPFEKHLRQVDKWLDCQPVALCAVCPNHRVLSEPRMVAEKLAQFLQAALDVEAMAGQVDPALYRKRVKKRTSAAPVA